MTPGAVAVFCGGDSSEREVSLRSGRAVHKALAETGIRTELVDIRDGDYVERFKKGGFETAFIALHGKFGEDGGIQKILEREGIRYTGSGPEACRAAMDKAESRRLFEDAGIRIPRGITVESPSDPRLAHLVYPVFVKPATGGSSIGVTCAKTRGELAAALDAAFKEDARAVVEERISGREMTVGILGEDVLPLIEIIPARDFYDYEAKYGEAGTRYEVPRDLPEAAERELKHAAIAAHRALGCSGFSRVDFILAPDGSAYALEVNAIPGLTEKSLLPKMASGMGITFAALCRRIMEESARTTKGVKSAHG